MNLAVCWAILDPHIGLRYLSIEFVPDFPARELDTMERGNGEIELFICLELLVCFTLGRW
jgi:hypothetical protein